jgi:hypothetical protein
MNTCTPAFERLAATVGGINCKSSGLVTFQNPLALHSRTQPIIELALIVGAAASLVHAVRVRHRTGSSTNLIVWWAAALCPLLIEPAAYFPQVFGLDQTVGLTFIHDTFTVTFLYNRLPLYIIAMYPVYIYVAFLMMQRAGVATRHHPLVAAAVVAVVFVVLYEVIDQVGPQFQWWIWNYHVPSGLPKLGAVPFASISGFSIGVPFGVAWLSLLATRRTNDRVALKVLGVSVGAVLVMLLTGMPARIYDVFLSRRPATLAGTVTIFVLCVACSAWAYRPAWSTLARATTEDLGDPRARFLNVVVVAYLLLGVGFWLVALPGYFDARHDLVPGAGQQGSLPVAVIGAVASLVLLVGANRIADRAHPAVSAEPETSAVIT